jgi:hypothetical protein
MLRVEAQRVAKPVADCIDSMPGAGESKSLALFHQTPHFQNGEDDTSAERGNRKH